jgi:hypothetical protein
MMNRHPLIRDFSGRGASHLSGVTAELRSLGEKTSLRMSLSELLVNDLPNFPSLDRLKFPTSHHLSFVIEYRRQHCQRRLRR